MKEDGSGECEDALEALTARMIEARTARKHCGQATACERNSMGQPMQRSHKLKEYCDDRLRHAG